MMKPFTSGLILAGLAIIVTTGFAANELFKSTYEKKIQSPASGEGFAFI